MQGVKHLIDCHCSLPQYKYRDDPVFHRFVVFSVVDDNDIVVPKTVQCNNCGIVHNVNEIGKSEIVINSDDTRAVLNIDDIKLSLPNKIAGVLESYKVDQATWEEAQFIVENEQWGRSVTLSKEEKAGSVNGKRLIIIGANIVKIEPFGGQSVLGDVKK